MLIINLISKSLFFWIVIYYILLIIFMNIIKKLGSNIFWYLKINNVTSNKIMNQYPESDTLNKNIKKKSKPITERAKALSDTRLHHISNKQYGYDRIFPPMHYIIIGPSPAPCSRINLVIVRYRSELMRLINITITRPI